MTEVLIRAENVGKKFCRDLKRSLWYGVKDAANDLMRRKTVESLRRDEFWANEDINFELKRGECLGLIGRNGAGKTTLLKMLNGLVKPDKGQIEMRGRVAALIAIGAGFNPVLTARENIFVNGSILGLSQRQIKDKLEDIIDFAEIHNFVDSPVRTYSSGMKVRLGFGIAGILAQPDILLLDEVLAVGDRGFKIKCLNRVRELTRTSAVILVSHMMQQIGAFCTRTLVMQTGRVALDSANVGEAIDHYNALFRTDKERTESGNGNASLINIKMTPDGVIQHSSHNLAALDSVLTLDLEIVVHGNAPCRFAVGVKTATDEPLMLLHCADNRSSPLEVGTGTHHLRAELPVGDLTAGEYRLHLTATDKNNNIALRVDGLAAFRVKGNEVSWQRIVRNATSFLEPSSSTFCTDTINTSNHSQHHN